MNSAAGTGQGGYVLILVLLALMAFGGFAAATFTQEARQEVEHERFLHNQRVLEDAKRALLMYAYNYPRNNVGRGPGRLPCPDTDNDGQPDPSFNCINGTAMVGRFPWADLDMNFYDAEDASGERLWYAVSASFANTITPVAADVVNSGSVGTITLFDQTGGIVYDGAAAGIAAVIIAPGPVTRRDNNADGSYEFTQLRNTAAQQIDPRNYLDTLTGFDNSLFVNGGNADLDGFILGPIFDPNEEQIVVNDQFAVITADEVIAMAEKATLEAYREAVDTYQTNIWGAAAASYRYPWLNDYATIVAGADLNLYDPRNADQIAGRVPYLNYHTDHDSHVLVTDVQVGFDITLTYNSMVDNSDPFDPTYIDVFANLFTGFPAGAQTLDISASNLSFGKITFDGLTDNTTDQVGTLISETGGTAVVNAAPGSTLTMYFWDGCAACDVTAEDGWEVCNLPATSAEDCAKDEDFPHNFESFEDGWDDHADIRIRLVTLSLQMDPDFVVELDYDPAPGITYDSAPGLGVHARFTGTYNAAEVTNMSIANAAETSTRNFIDIVVDSCEQDDYVSSELNLYALGNANASTVLCTPDLVTDATYTLNNQFTLTADYHLPLPIWVSDNNWNSSMLMAYANDYSPDPVSGQDCGANPPCITVNRLHQGQTTDNVMVLVSANRVPADETELANNFEDDNSTPLDNVFTAQPEPGDDSLLVFDEI